MEEEQVIRDYFNVVPDKTIPLKSDWEFFVSVSIDPSKINLFAPIEFPITRSAVKQLLFVSKRSYTFKKLYLKTESISSVKLYTVKKELSLSFQMNERAEKQRVLFKENQVVIITSFLRIIDVNICLLSNPIVNVAFSQNKIEEYFKDFDFNSVLLQEDAAAVRGLQITSAMFNNKLS